MGKQKKVTIFKDTKLLEIVQKFPQAAELLMEKYHLHCFGCAMAPYETLEEGVRAHGMEDKEIGKLVKQLNNLTLKKKKK